jgi:hypothetical protein
MAPACSNYVFLLLCLAMRRGCRRWRVCWAVIDRVGRSLTTEGRPRLRLRWQMLRWHSVFAFLANESSATRHVCFLWDGRALVSILYAREAMMRWHATVSGRKLKCGFGHHMFYGINSQQIHFKESGAVLGFGASGHLEVCCSKESR